MAERATPSGAPSAHADHDTILVAALAAGDLIDTARSDAEALVAACTACATLHADLLAIAAATRALPAPVRSRDFRLSAAQAQQLRPSAPRRWLEALASPRLAVTKPIAVAFTTLGLAGLLLTTIPAAGPATLLSAVGDRVGAGQAPEANDAGGLGPSPAPEFVGSPPLAEPLPPGEVGAGVGGTPGSGDGVTGAEEKDDGESTPTRDLALADDDGPPWLALLSIGLLATGLALFALRFAAHRASAD